MQIQMESTGRIVEIDGVPCREWHAVTAGGVPCIAFVHRIAVHNAADQSQFDAELLAQLPPRRTPELAASLDTFAQQTEA